MLNHDNCRTENIMVENIVIAKLVSFIFFSSSIQIILKQVETFSSTSVNRLSQKEHDFQVERINALFIC